LSLERTIESAERPSAFVSDVRPTRLERGIESLDDVEDRVIDNNLNDRRRAVIKRYQSRMRSGRNCDRQSRDHHQKIGSDFGAIFPLRYETFRPCVQRDVGAACLYTLFRDQRRVGVASE
jgi:hypothetical protein